jgi:ADP-ribose pyrophosphatase YjhB (NUDIX family)
MFKYCPSCASENIRFERKRVFICPDCGFTYYHNNAAATACVVNTGSGIIFLVRAKEPGKGLLDLPGGFIDPGESAVEGLCRELSEELSFAPDQKALRFFASFPNVYTYKNISYNTCDLFFYLDAPGITEKDLCLETAEVSALKFIKKEDVDFNNLAFESVKKAVRLYIDTNVIINQG